MIVSIFLSVSHCALDIFGTGKHVSQGDEYEREIPTDFHFFGPKKAIKLAKNIIKVEENLNEIVKHCPK